MIEKILEFLFGKPEIPESFSRNHDLIFEKEKKFNEILNRKYPEVLFTSLITPQLSYQHPDRELKVEFKFQIGDRIKREMVIARGISGPASFELTAKETGYIIYQNYQASFQPGELMYIIASTKLEIEDPLELFNSL